MENMAVEKEAVKDLVKVKDEFDAIVESLELASDKRFMRSYKQARKEVKNRDFADWNEL